MWNRLKSSGWRWIALVVAAAAAVIVGVVLLAAGEDERGTGAPLAVTTAPDPSEAPVQQGKGKDPEEAKPPRPAEDPDAAPGAVEPDVLEDFQDCVRANGGRPIDLTPPPEEDDQDYTPKEIEALREARAACIEELPPEIREQAERQAENLEDSPFRACVVEQQAAGSEIAEAVQSCEDEIAGN